MYSIRTYLFSRPPSSLIIFQRAGAGGKKEEGRIFSHICAQKKSGAATNEIQSDALSRYCSKYSHACTHIEFQEYIGIIIFVPNAFLSPKRDSVYTKMLLPLNLRWKEQQQHQQKEKNKTVRKERENEESLATHMTHEDKKRKNTSTTKRQGVVYNRCLR